MIFSKVALIDHDYRRKAAISTEFREAGIYCDPYSDVCEFIEMGPSLSCIIAADDGPCSSIELMNKLQEEARDNLVVAYSDKVDVGRVADTILAGAIDFVAWPFNAQQLMQRLDKRKGMRSHPGHWRNLAISAKRKLRVLTPREDEVIAALAEGLSNKGIAKLIGISPRTVEIHRANAMNKLHVEHPAKAIKLKFEAELF